MVNKKQRPEKKYYSVVEAAKLLGISRIAVYKRIKTGKLTAELIGQTYAIPAKAVAADAPGELTAKSKSRISKGVDRVFDEYGETLKLLGKE